MAGRKPRLPSGQVHWRDTGAGRLAILHLSLGAFIIFNLLRYDYGGFAISMAVITTITCFGTLVMLFVAQARVKDSERYARCGFGLAIAFVCLSVVVVVASWTYVVGFALVSVVYFAESVIALVLAWRTVTELRKFSNKKTFLSIC